MANNIDRECCEILAEKFYKNAGFALGKGNGYEQTILEPRFEMLAEKVKDTYPEYYQSFASAREIFIQKFKQLYSEEKKTANRDSMQGAVQSK